jgi:hypothetical protein
MVVVIVVHLAGGHLVHAGRRETWTRQGRSGQTTRRKTTNNEPTKRVASSGRMLSRSREMSNGKREETGEVLVVRVVPLNDELFTAGRLKQKKMQDAAAALEGKCRKMVGQS